ncbi:GPI-GlcNAc transferase complex, PIG-H component-domain-containing protein [Alternaria rosae]|uniref:GPI-GlcNAc transferase complex, PIG-H component-domain-containing protein n=1 Tax=Alternaria rosae TaxID=1187941 RepID=UPI001E8CF137|nr:GPI-GlcNAc transferase complex, PIG-H component-domain-containing protein [Alternaria rosae]KAH6870487.1 GPI-GlcNAc transferase complex, PIG-H component-domain-containing protein [Alternaria rosae]
MLTLIDRFNSPPAQTLQVLQPTSSTITYTVSTRSVPKTLPASVAYYAGILTRVLLGITSVLLLWIKWRVTQAQSLDLSLGVLSHEAERQLVKLAEACQWRYLVPSTLLILFLVLRRNYTEESLTVLRGLGVQTSTTSSTYLQTPTTRFIPTTSIQDVFIHEAFKGFEVRFFLMIVVEGEGEVVVVFPRLLPRRATLETVWRGVRGGLWEDSVRAQREKT